MKKIFRLTKGTVITAFLVILSVAILGAGGAYAFDQIAQNNSIGADAAMGFAFIDAGILPEQAMVLKNKFDFEDGHFVYEIDFIANGVKYEYTVRASDGVIMEMEQELIEGYRGAAQTELTVGQELAKIQATGYIGVEEAKRVAMERAGITAQDAPTFTHMKLDNDDGRMVYEIEFIANGTEYDVDVDATSGSVTSYSAEVSVGYIAGSIPAQQGTQQPPVQQPQQQTQQQTQQQQQQPAQQPAQQSQQPAQPQQQQTQQPAQQQPQQQQPVPQQPQQPVQQSEQPAPQQEQTVTNVSYISVDQAKSIACAHAGASGVSFTKAKMDEENGRMVYEIEFYVGTTEYDYEIDAVTGAILDYDIDIDD